MFKSAICFNNSCCSNCCCIGFVGVNAEGAANGGELFSLVADGVELNSHVVDAGWPDHRLPHLQH